MLSSKHKTMSILVIQCFPIHDLFNGEFTKSPTEEYFGSLIGRAGPAVFTSYILQDSKSPNFTELRRYSDMPRNTKRIREAPRSRGKSSGPPRKGPAPKPQGTNTQKKGPVQANQRPIVPFLRKDRILLIGEGENTLLEIILPRYPYKIHFSSNPNP